MRIPQYGIQSTKNTLISRAYTYTNSLRFIFYEFTLYVDLIRDPLPSLHFEDLVQCVGFTVSITVSKTRNLEKTDLLERERKKKNMSFEFHMMDERVMWTCINCTNVNPGYTDDCMVCGSSQIEKTNSPKDLAHRLGVVHVAVCHLSLFLHVKFHKWKINQSLEHYLTSISFTFIHTHTHVYIYKYTHSTHQFFSLLNRRSYDLNKVRTTRSTVGTNACSYTKNL